MCTYEIIMMMPSMSVVGGLGRRPLDLMSHRVRVVVTTLRLADRIARTWRPNGDNSNVGRWLAHELPKLGATYVKIGQFIASRSDIYGPEFSACFGDMHSRVDTVRDSDAARRLIASGLGEDAMRRFVSICYDTATSASLAQVHRGVLDDGRRVVVKVIKPGVIDSIHLDMRLVSTLVELMHRVATMTFAPHHVHVAVRQARVTVRDLETYLLQETDLTSELAHLTRFYELYGGGGGASGRRRRRRSADAPLSIRVPRPLPELSNRNVLVMEDVPSTLLCSEGAVSDPELARKVMSAFMQQLLCHGVLHGDPHGGNMGVDESGSLVMYDFGSIIRLTPREIWGIKNLILALAVGNAERVSVLLEETGAEIVDPEALVGYIADYRSYMMSMDTTELMRKASTRATSSHKMPIVLPPHISRLLRSFILLEGVCRRLDPTFTYLHVVGDVASQDFFDAPFLVFKVLDDLKRVLLFDEASDA